MRAREQAAQPRARTSERDMGITGLTNQGHPEGALLRQTWLPIVRSIASLFLTAKKKPRATSCSKGPRLRGHVRPRASKQQAQTQDYSQAHAPQDLAEGRLQKRQGKAHPRMTSDGLNSRRRETQPTPQGGTHISIQCPRTRSVAKENAAIT
jgi:hypothetical protein